VPKASQFAFSEEVDTGRPDHRSGLGYAHFSL